LKAAFYYEPNDLRIEEAEVPTITEEDLLVRIEMCSVCGTDIRTMKNGHFKIQRGTRRVLGHELAGRIVRAGSRVRGYPEGVRVTVTPNIGCCACDLCRLGFNQLCPNYEAFGITIDGGFQQVMKVPDRAIRAGNIFNIPECMSYEKAALVEPLSCCYSALRTLRTCAEDTVLIIGAGPIGALHVMLSRLSGAKRIIVADTSTVRLNKALEFGADVTVNSREGDLLTEVMGETSGKGADVIVLACSDPDMQGKSLELSAIHARISLFAGIPSTVKSVPLNTNLIHYRGLHLFGTSGSSNSDYHNALGLVIAGKVDPTKLISASFSLLDISRAFEYTAGGQGLKTMVVCR